MNFSCANCHLICDWDTRAPVADQDNAEYKTIGSRYCNAPTCIDAESKAHGLPVERVLRWH